MEQIQNNAANSFKCSKENFELNAISNRQFLKAVKKSRNVFSNVCVAKSMILYLCIQIRSQDVAVSFNARSVRLIPLAYEVFPCMRIEIYGCKGTTHAP